MPANRSSTSPHASTSYLPPSGAGQAPAEQDPFLAQTAGIPLTERDRQEGYDVELLNARPRGAYSDTDNDSLGARGEKYAGGAAGGPVGVGAATRGATPVGLAGAGGAAAGGAGGFGEGYGAAKEYADDGAAAQSRTSGTTARTGRRRPWFLRPLPLGILAAFLIAVALAIGLGVGLSERNRGTSNQDDVSASGALSTSTDSRSRTSSTRTRTTNTMTTGTVVPSSLYSSYTSDHPQTTDTAAATITTDSRTLTESSTSTLPSSLTTVPSPASGTTLATTGNLPIPAESATTISGSITVSRISSASAIAVRAKKRARRWEA
ncbi:hypothetical protein JCM1840_004450 [Sporobolomyces johnsonii]